MAQVRTRANASSFVKQAAILAVASLLVRFIGFLYRLPLTNLIGDEGNAYYAAGYTIYMFALILSSAGLPAAVSKLVSERLALKQYRNAHEVFKVSMAVALGLGAAAALFLALGAEWLARMTGYPEAVYAIRTLSPTIFVVSALAVYRGYFQGMRNSVPTAVSQVIEQIINAFCSIWLAYLFFDAAHIEYAAAGSTAGTGLGGLAGLLVVMGIYSLAKPTIQKKVRRDKDQSQYIPRGVIAVTVIKTALPIIVGTAIFSIAGMIDMTMVSDRLAASGAFTYEDIKNLYGQLTGKYVVLTTLPVSLSTALATAAIPSIAGSYILLDKNAVKSKINMAIRLSMIVSIPAAVGLGVLSDPILLLLFRKHSEGGILLQYGVISIIFLALVQIITGILQGVGRVHIPVIGALCGTLVKIPLNYFLIADPRFNILGAVISTCVCYMVAAGINIYFLHKHTGIWPDFIGAFAKPTLASAVMGLACYVSYNAFMYLSAHNTVSTVLAILIGLLSYLAFMALIKGFRREDLMMLPKSDRWIRLLWWM